MTNLTVIPSAEPEAGIVSMLEDLLARAKAGDIKAFAYITVSPGGYVGTGWDNGSTARSHEIRSGVMLLGHRHTESALRDAG